MAIRIQIATVLSFEVNLCEIAQKQIDFMIFIQTLGRDKKIIIGLGPRPRSELIFFFQFCSVSFIRMEIFAKNVQRHDQV